MLLLLLVMFKEGDLDMFKGFDCRMEEEDLEQSFRIEEILSTELGSGFVSGPVTVVSSTSSVYLELRKLSKLLSNALRKGFSGGAALLAVVVLGSGDCCGKTVGDACG